MRKTFTNYRHNFVWAFALAIGIFAFSSSASAQLLNEILVNPNGTDSNCEYVEIIGTPGGSLTNVYFASIEGDGTSAPGTFDVVVDLSTATLGTNGLLVLTTDAMGDCDGRDYNSPPTNRVLVTGLQFENGTNSWALISSPTTPITEGTDYDSDDDGTPEGLPGDATILDAFGFNDGGDGDITYGAELPPTAGGGADAATRFPGNTDANSASAFYYGDVDGDNTSLMYDLTQVSDNFPEGGMLTPGDVNVGTQVGGPADKANVDFNGDGISDFVVTRPNSTMMLGGEAPITWYINENGSGDISYAQWGIESDFRVPADYDGDGSDDVAVFRPNYNGNENSAFFILQSSDATVRAEDFGLIGDDPRVVGDYDGDGTDDLAVYRQNAGGLNYFYFKGSSNNPNGGVSAIQWGSGEFIRPNKGDYDGDGKLDFCVYNQSGTFFLLRSSDFEVEYIQWGLGSEALVPGDFDGDGLDDFAVVRFVNGQRNWFILERNGGLTRGLPFGLSSDMLAPGDYDGDGVQDIAVWRPSNGVFYILNSSDNSVRYFQWGREGDAPEADWAVHEAGAN